MPRDDVLQGIQVEVGGRRPDPLAGGALAVAVVGQAAVQLGKVERGVDVVHYAVLPLAGAAVRGPAVAEVVHVRDVVL